MPPLSLICGLLAVPVGIFFGKLSKFLISLANVYNSSTISGTVPGLFNLLHVSYMYVVSQATPFAAKGVACEIMCWQRTKHSSRKVFSV